MPHRRAWAGHAGARAVPGLWEGDLDTAEAQISHGLGLARNRGDRWYAMLALEDLTEVARARGDDLTAHALLDQQVLLVRALGDRTATAAVLGEIAELDQTRRWLVRLRVS